MNSSKIKMTIVIGLTVLVGAVVIYQRSHFTKQSTDLSQCTNWYKLSYTGWRDWATLPADKKVELRQLEPSIDSVITAACKCLWERSAIFREQTLPQHGLADTSSYIDLEIAEAKKFQAECKIPDFFTWATPDVVSK